MKRDAEKELLQKKQIKLESTVNPLGRSDNIEQLIDSINSVKHTKAEDHKQEESPQKS